MTKSDIIDLWVSVGWNNLHDYHEHLKTADQAIVLKQLDPDLINAREFWSAADQHFATDPVCNHHNNINDTQFSIKESNLHNHKIPLSMGMIAQVEHVVSQLMETTGRVSIAEIGCGYGSFYDNYVDLYPFDGMTYQGFDVVARTKHAVETEGMNGCFSDHQVNKYHDQFNLFYSSNTFQHLSRRQITAYLYQTYHMLPYGGYFVVMYVDEGETSTYHYGQKVQLMSIKQFQQLAVDQGYSILGSATMKFHNSLTPHSLILKK